MWDNYICTSLFISRKKLKCLETKARYSIGRHCIFGKKHGLPNDNLAIDNVLTFILSDQGFASSFSTVVHTWGLHLKGPVYVSNFKPLSIAIAAAMTVIFLGDALYLGRYASERACTYEDIHT